MRPLSMVWLGMIAPGVWLITSGAESRFKGKPAKRRFGHNGEQVRLIDHTGEAHSLDGGAIAMALSVRRLATPFGAEIIGADLHQAPTSTLIETVNAAVTEHAVVVLRDQQINDAEQVRFSRAFGPMELPPHMGLQGAFRRRVAPELFDVSNLDENGDFLPVESLRLASNRANEAVS